MFFSYHQHWKIISLILFCLYKPATLIEFYLKQWNFIKFPRFVILFLMKKYVSLNFKTISRLFKLSWLLGVFFCLISILLRSMYLFKDQGTLNPIWITKRHNLNRVILKSINLAFVYYIEIFQNQIPLELVYASILFFIWKIFV